MTNKTVENDASVDEFIDSIEDVEQRHDSHQLLKLFSEISGHRPAMWGDAIIGFGKVSLTYASGWRVDWLRVGFSPRKGKLSLYITFDAKKLTSQFPKLGKYNTGKGCIYIRRLQDVDDTELRRLLEHAYRNGYEVPRREDGREV